VNLGEMHGKWFEKFGARVLVTYHPAAGMRFPEVGREMEGDFGSLLLGRGDRPRQNAGQA